MIRLRVDGLPAVVVAGGPGRLLVRSGERETELTPASGLPVAIIQATEQERRTLAAWGFPRILDADLLDAYLRAQARKGAGKGLRNPRKRSSTSRTAEWWAEWRRRKQQGEGAA